MQHIDIDVSGRTLPTRISSNTHTFGPWKYAWIAAHDAVHDADDVLVCSGPIWKLTWARCSGSGVAEAGRNTRLLPLSARVCFFAASSSERPKPPQPSPALCSHQPCPSQLSSTLQLKRSQKYVCGIFWIGEIVADPGTRRTCPHRFEKRSKQVFVRANSFPSSIARINYFN